MHELELLTRSGPIILMSRTRKGLYAAFRRFISSDSLPNEDEPDETDIPIYIHNGLLKERHLLKGEGRELVL